MEVGTQRPRKVRGKELAQAPAGDAPDHFADQVAVVQQWLGSEQRLTALDVSSIADIAPPTRRSPTFEWRRSRR